MASDKKSKYWYQDEESLYQYIKSNEDEWSTWGEKAQEVFDPDNWLKYQDGQSGKAATSWQDSGRRCVYCGDLYRVFEQSEYGDLLLYCDNCGKKVWNMDVTPYSQAELKEMKKYSDGIAIRDIPDMLYRDIPDDFFMDHMQRLERMRSGD